MSQPQSQIQQPSGQQPMYGPSPNSGSSLGLIFGIFLVIIVIGLVAYILYSRKQQVPVPQPVPVPFTPYVPTPAPTPAPEPVIDWTDARKNQIRQMITNTPIFNDCPNNYPKMIDCIMTLITDNYNYADAMIKFSQGLKPDDLNLLISCLTIAAIREMYDKTVSNYTTYNGIDFKNQCTLDCIFNQVITTNNKKNALIILKDATKMADIAKSYCTQCIPITPPTPPAPGPSPPTPPAPSGPKVIDVSTFLGTWTPVDPTKTYGIYKSQLCKIAQIAGGKYSISVLASIIAGVPPTYPLLYAGPFSFQDPFLDGYVLDVPVLSNVIPDTPMNATLRFVYDSKLNQITLSTSDFGTKVPYNFTFGK